VNRPAILLVEDNPTARKMFRITLEAEGYRVLEAIDGRAALDQLRRELPGLVLQDLVLPDHDGFELARAIRALPGAAALPIIVMSGFPRLLDRARTETTCFDASLVKPVSPAVLVDLVRRYLPAPIAVPEGAGDFGRGKSILIIDDDPVQLKLARLRFTGAGFEVTTADDSAAALALAQARPPDVVLCDVLMPGTDGYELCMALRRCPELSGMPVVLVSAHYGGSRDEALARAAGASALVTRTPALEETFDAVRASLVERTAPAPEDVAFRERHQASIIAQLERRAFANAAAAERSALQSAQLSVLAGITEALARSEDIDSALADVLAACLDAGGITRGALFRADAGDHQALSASVGFPADAVAQVERRFGFPAMLDQEDRGLVTPHDVLSPEDADTFLARAGVAVAVIVPVMDGARRVAALLLGTDVPGVDEQALSTFGRALAAHIAHALALTAAFTRLRDAAADNARLYEAARDANRAKDEFLATVSHELRSPLNAVLGWAQMLRDGLPEAQREKAIAAIERNAFLQAALIDDLLDMSRMISGTMRLELGAIRLGPIVEAAIEALGPQLDAKAVKLAVRMTSTSSLMGDAARLQQIVSNLLSNAIKFTPAGGVIELELADAGELVQLTVRDDGKGIAREFLPHVFDRFKQADGSSSRTHGGLGLGLAIVRHLTELHGGTIAADSNGPGHGAVFTVTLPRTTVIAIKPQGDRAGLGVHGHAGQLRGMAILVVDDEPDTREMMVSLLQMCGASTMEASSAAEALGLLTERRPDVLLSDLGMPGEDGFSLIHKVRALPDAEGGSTPAIALSGYASSEDRNRALEAGFQQHLSKPVNMTDLMATLMNLSQLASAAK
jgi:CheY-like chemotaxis protein